MAKLFENASGQNLLQTDFIVKFSTHIARNLRFCWTHFRKRWYRARPLNYPDWCGCV